MAQAIFGPGCRPLGPQLLTSVNVHRLTNHRGRTTLPCYSAPNVQVESYALAWTKNGHFPTLFCDEQIPRNAVIANRVRIRSKEPLTRSMLDDAQVAPKCTPGSETRMPISWQLDDKGDSSSPKEAAFC